MNKSLLLSITSLLAFSASTSAQSTYQVTLSPNTTYQTIQDFGASDCWTADFVGKYFSDAEKEKSARWLFSREFDVNGNPEGIGLSVWRINLGAGSAEQGDGSGIDDITRRGYCYLDAKGTYDWTKSAGQQYFMQQAKKYGVDHYLLFCNSAPVQFTKNGKACANAGEKGCNLNDNHYGDFASFLTTTTKHFIDEGYNITLISPVNEPQYVIRPGYRRISHTTNQSESLNKLMGSAYVSPDGKRTGHQCILSRRQDGEAAGYVARRTCKRRIRMEG